MPTHNKDPGTMTARFTHTLTGHQVIVEKKAGAPYPREVIRALA